MPCRIASDCVETFHLLKRYKCWLIQVTPW